MASRVDVDGDTAEMAGLGDEILAELRPRAERALKAVLLYAEGELKLTLTGARSGRTYRVSKTGALHVASAPNEPPAVLFGALRNSVGHRGPVWEGYELHGMYGVGLGTKPARPEDDPETYARRLEYGGIDSRGIKIEPRPYMAPTEQRIEPTIDRMLESML